MSDLSMGEVPPLERSDGTEDSPRTSEEHETIVPSMAGGGRGFSAPGTATLEAFARTLRSHGWTADVWDVDPPQIILVRCPACQAGGAGVMLGWDDAIEPLCGCDPSDVLAAAAQSPRPRLRSLPLRPDGDAWTRPVSPRDVGVPPFPVDALPDPLKNYVVALARSTQTPLDLAGLTVLGSLAGLCGGRVKVRVRTGWAEPATLYTMVVLPPGERKSAVVRQATMPLLQVEEELARSTADARRQIATERDVLTQRVTHLKRQASREDDPAARTQLVEAASAAEAALASLPTSHSPRLVANDVTPEKLTTLLADHGRMTVVAAEGGFFETIAGRYSKGGAPNLDTVLAGHAGDAIRVDRVSRESERIDEPALSLVLAVQPDVLQGLMAKDGFAGRGLLARFLYAVPSPMVGRREAEPEPMSDDDSGAYARMMLNVGLSVTTLQEPVTLSLTKEAHDRVVSMQEQVEAMLDAGGRLSDLAGWGAKLVGAAVRIAGLIHVAEWGGASGEITWHTMDRAIRLAWYFAEHARQAFAVMGGLSEVSDADTVLRWLLRRGVDRISLRDVMRGDALGRDARDTDRYERALARLGELGWVAQEPTPTSSKRGGRPPSPTFVVSPIARDAAGKP